MDSHSQAQAHKILTNFLLSRTHHPETNDIASPPPAYSFHQEQNDDEQDEEESTLSPITIHISTPLTISGTSNLVLLPPTTRAATSIAVEVMRALKRSTMGEAGIPMIDEDGRPRPIDVKVEAGVRIEGRGNVVGEKGALEGLRKIVRENAGARAREMEVLRGRGQAAGASRKRRASSAPAGEREGKRERIA